MEVTIDKKTCIGCGSCVAICPEVFEMKNNKASVKESAKKLKELPSCAKSAEESCPVDAIKIK